MSKNPKKITVTDENGKLKSIQIYEYNENGDPILFKKKDGTGKIVVDWVYEYKYGLNNEKLEMKIKDLQTKKETIMSYEY